MKSLSLYWILAVVLTSAAVAQTAATPQILLAVPQPSAAKPFNVNVIVESQGDSYNLPVPTGNVTVNFGDGTTPTVSTLTNSLVVVSHTYASAGSGTINASYAGDSNFSAISTSQKGIVLASAPAAKTYYAFGDSITADTGASPQSDGYPSVIAATEGWTLTNYAHGGDRAPDQCVQMYGTTASSGILNSLLIGQNDDVYVADDHYTAQYQASLLACGAWVMLTGAGADGTPTKLIAQDSRVTKSGNWQTSDLYAALGVKTLEAGDTLTATVDGSVLYLGMTASAETVNSYTVAVTVDGVSQGSFTPDYQYPGQETTYVPWGIRLPLSTSGAHKLVLTCTAPGAAGCYVDWIGGNGTPATLPRPSLWYGTPYLPLLGKGSDLYTSMRNIIIPLQQQLAADGLNAYLADTYNWFVGYTQPQCMYDNFHPSDCGHALLAATYMGSMDVLLASAAHVQLSTSGLHDFVAVGDGQTATYGVKLTNETGIPYPYQLGFSGSAEFSHASNCPATLVAGANCEIVFSFSPVSGESSWASAQWSLTNTPGIVVLSQNGGTLEGNAYPSTALTLNTAKHNFGNVTVGSGSNSFNLVVVNPNSKSFTGSIAWTGASSQFSMSGNCSLPLPAFSNCVETIVFTPSATGWQSAALVINPAQGESVSPSSTVTFIGNGQ